jgi:hypothetical protein
MGFWKKHMPEAIFDVQSGLPRRGVYPGMFLAGAPRNDDFKQMMSQQMILTGNMHYEK